MNEKLFAELKAAAANIDKLETETNKAVAALDDEIVEDRETKTGEVLDFLREMMTVLESVKMPGNMKVLWWDFIIKQIESFDGKLYSGLKIWTDGSEILVNTASAAEIIADFMAVLGYDSHIGYYDPKDDERDHCVDRYTGWWYIDYD